MSKWIWRFLIERDLLWARVVRACQGDICWDGEGFWVAGNRGMRPGWWNNMLGLSWGEGEKWFRENLEMQIGEGDTILFWHHCWTGERSLSEMFPRLYHLSNNQGGYIKSMGKWVEDEWEWRLTWNRELLERELDQINNLIFIINNFRVCASEKDGWRWKTSSNGRFSVNTSYKVLCLEAKPVDIQKEEKEWPFIWKAPAPFKARTTSWKVLKGRLATCDELQKRHVAIQNSEALCVFCKLKPESIDHIFFECQKTDEVGKNILRWIGKQSPNHHKANEHMLAFINLGNKEDIQFLLGVWICTIWCVWKGRNECMFNQGTWRTERTLTEIKTMLWGWSLAFNLPTSSTEFRRWFSAVKLCG
ncbi:uncharacterized protein LOC131025797 [Salvia miltiorrhiza]|uniref:uncharacterized protein LOC131025797 n=1 Tax=Salvia miltiorrhiza TaxID=226208 RepID=UPI0025ACF85A|nr:uncharacterized protein LOC131025797 [Salvia miltiorrhiza]